MKLIYLTLFSLTLLTGCGGGGDSNSSPTDTDNDGITDSNDNCISTSNPNQTDTDNDGIGDVCDSLTDSDNDTISDTNDNCPANANQDQADSDNDGIGNVCDAFTDSDNDTIADSSDNCPNHSNQDQADTDDDGIGNVCDALTDSDNDTIADSSDNCPNHPNQDQANLDNDSFGNACDDDIDGDTLSNNQETAIGTDPNNADSDADGIFDNDDTSPLVSAFLTTSSGMNPDPTYLQVESLTFTGNSVVETVNSMDSAQLDLSQGTASFKVSFDYETPTVNSFITDKFYITFVDGTAEQATVGDIPIGYAITSSYFDNSFSGTTNLNCNITNLFVATCTSGSDEISFDISEKINAIPKTLSFVVIGCKENPISFTCSNYASINVDFK